MAPTPPRRTCSAHGGAARQEARASQETIAERERAIKEIEARVMHSGRAPPWFAVLRLRRCALPLHPSRAPSLQKTVTEVNEIFVDLGQRARPLIWSEQWAEACACACMGMGMGIRMHIYILPRAMATAAGHALWCCCAPSRLVAGQAEQINTISNNVEHTARAAWRPS